MIKQIRKIICQLLIIVGCKFVSNAHENLSLKLNNTAQNWERVNSVKSTIR